MQLVVVHGSGQNELTYHYQTAEFADADAVNLPGHPDGESKDSIGGYVDWLREYAQGKGYRLLCCLGTPWEGRLRGTMRCGFPMIWPGLMLIGTGTRLQVHPDYLNRCLDGLHRFGLSGTELLGSPGRQRVGCGFGQNGQFPVRTTLGSHADGLGGQRSCNNVQDDQAKGHGHDTRRGPL